MVEIEARGAANSWAKIIADFTEGKAAAMLIEQGSQAVLIDPVDIHLKRQIRLVYHSDINSTDSSTMSSRQIKNDYEKEALDKIKTIISEEGKGFLELAAEKTDKADYQIAINERGEYEIWDPAGKLMPNLNPPLKTNENESAVKLVQRLVHLTKYSNIMQLDNLDAASPLSRKLVAELVGVSQDYEPGDNPEDFPEPIEFQGNSKVVKVGQKLVLRIKNSLPKETGKGLNVTVLDLQPDWGVKQIYPTSPVESFIPIDPGREEFFPLQAALPSSYVEGKDIIKVFGTIEQTNFRWLELPSLDQPLVQREATRGSSPRNALEELMAAITKDKAVTRDLNPSATPSKEWTSVQIEVQVTS